MIHGCLDLSQYGFAFLVVPIMQHPTQVIVFRVCIMCKHLTLIVATQFTYVSQAVA